MKCHECQNESDTTLNSEGYCMTCAARRPIPTEPLEVLIECPVETYATMRVIIDLPITATEDEAKALIEAAAKKVRDLGDDELDFEISSSTFEADIHYHLAKICDEQDCSPEVGYEHDEAAWYRRAHGIEESEEMHPDQGKLF